MVLETFNKENVHGYVDHTFKPNQAVIHAEFIKSMIKNT